MATPTTTPIEIPAMLQKLAPASTYEWLGSPESGIGLYSDIGQWFGPDPKPTEQEVYDEWDLYLAVTAATTPEQRQLDLGDITPAKVQQAIDRLTADRDQIPADSVFVDDLAALAAAGNLAQAKVVVERMLQRQRAEAAMLRFAWTVLIRLIKALRHLV